MIGADAHFYLYTKLGGWGTGGLDHIEPEALAEYERCFCRAEAIHAAGRTVGRREAALGHLRHRRPDAA